jgi:hypothetical protein
MKNYSPAIVRKSTIIRTKMYSMTYNLSNMYMKKYKNNMTDYEYNFWLQMFQELIYDEIDGFVNHQYSRITCSSLAFLTMFIKKEFNDLMVPICTRAVRRDFNREKRRASIEMYNKSSQNIDIANSDMSSNTCKKVRINLDANQIQVFERDN